MGCGQSRTNKSGLNLPNACNNPDCNKIVGDVALYSTFINNYPIVSDAFHAEMFILDVDTLVRIDALGKSQINIISSGNTSHKTYGDFLRDTVIFLNNYGKPLTNQQIAILVDLQNNQGAQSCMPLLMITMGLWIKIGMNLPITMNQKTYYNRYVLELYNQVTHSPSYTSAQIITSMLAWLTANPIPNADAFTDLTTTPTEVNIFFSFFLNKYNNNKQTSGFTNYGGIYSNTNLIPTNYHPF